MKPGYTVGPIAMADPEPPPDPAPLPIRIVRDPKPPLPPPEDSEAANIPTGKRNDEFYKAWNEVGSCQTR